MEYLPVAAISSAIDNAGMDGNRNMVALPVCLECGGDLDRIGLTHPLMISLVLNPFGWFAELVLGHRTATALYECDSCRDVPRTYISCQQCGDLHPESLWRQRHAIGHWFGLVCPACGGTISCIWLATSITILIATFPLWFVPAVLIKRRWLAYENKRNIKALNSYAEPKKLINWRRAAWNFALTTELTYLILTVSP